MIKFFKFIKELFDIISNFFIYKKNDINKIIKLKTLNLTGLEIGGPSWLWKSTIPIYRWAKRIDNYNRENLSNFNQIQDKGKNKFKYYLFKKGDQYLDDNFINIIENNNYDFIIMRAVLQHSANPIKLLIDLRNKIKNNGIIVISVPNKMGTFDYARNYTSFKHIYEDYKKNIKEDDVTHYEESIKLIHDHRNPKYNNREELRKLIYNNNESRMLHHHVFNIDTLTRTCSEAGFRVLNICETIFPEIIVVAEKYNDRLLMMKPELTK